MPRITFITTTGFLDSWGGTFGVVGTEAWMAPPDGACSTPGAAELPQADRVRAATAAAVSASGRHVIWSLTPTASSWLIAGARNVRAAPTGSSRPENRAAR